MEPKKEYNDTITYIGREPFALKSFRYIIGSTQAMVSFGKKLQRHHSVGRTYPAFVKDTKEGKVVSTSRSDFSIDKAFPFVTNKKLTEWAKNEAIAERTAKALREEKSILAETRKAARSLREQYRRASHANKLDMIRVFVEELEA